MTNDERSEERRRPGGLIARQVCPDCKHNLMPLCKITESRHVSHTQAKVCTNKQCWRSVAYEHLMTWKKAKSYPLKKLDKFDLLD